MNKEKYKTSLYKKIKENRTLTLSKYSGYIQSNQQKQTSLKQFSQRFQFTVYWKIYTKKFNVINKTKDNTVINNKTRTNNQTNRKDFFWEIRNL